MKKFFKVLLGTLAFLLTTFTSEVKAQDCGCGAALTKDKIESSDEGFEYFHYLEDIDEYQYEQIKKSTSASAKYKLIKGSANYSEFKEKVTESIRRTEIETGQQYKSNYYEARTSPIAYEYWGRCMESCNKIGLILWIQNESKSSLALLLKYRAGPNDPTTINYTVTIQHGNGTVETMAGRILANGTEPIAIKRKCASENGISQTTISVKGAGYSSDWITSKFYCGSIPIPQTQPCPKIEIKTFENTSGSSNRPSVSISVPDGYKIIGGGAKVNYSGVGCLLTESYPDGNRWIAKAKDHMVGNNASITAFAIAIYDPNNQWDVRVFQSTGSTASLPEAIAKVDEGYIMTGGGAKDNWSGAGNLLTASYPITNDTWKAKGKDHGIVDRANITVYAIGIKPIKSCSKKLENKIFQSSSSISLTPSGSTDISGNYFLTGGGTIANWPRFGSLLTSSYPSSDKQWSGSSKAHNYAENVSLDIYAIGIRYQ